LWNCNFVLTFTKSSQRTTFDLKYIPFEFFILFTALLGDYRLREGGEWEMDFYEVIYSRRSMYLTTAPNPVHVDEDYRKTVSIITPKLAYLTSYLEDCNQEGWYITNSMTVPLKLTYFTQSLLNPTEPPGRKGVLEDIGDSRCYVPIENWKKRNQHKKKKKKKFLQ